MPDVILFAPPRPHPTSTHVCLYDTDDGQTITAISRTWRPGDEAHCRRCATCVAYGGQCLLMINREIPRESAPTFSTIEYGSILKPR